MKRSIRCHCDHEFEIEIADVENLSPGSSAINEIISGDYLKVICARCGDVLRPDIEMRFDTGNETQLLLVPEKERDRFLFTGGANNDQVSVVIGFPELRERALLLEAGLDVRAIETLKYQILLRARAGTSDDIRIYYERTVNDAFEFSIHGLKKDEIALIDLPKASYDRALSALAETSDNEPYKTLFEGAYTSIHKLEIETET